MLSKRIYQICTNCRGLGITKLIFKLPAKQKSTKYYSCDDCNGKGYYRDIDKEAKERHLAQSREYHKKHREKIYAKQRIYRSKHKEQSNKSSRDYYWRNREEILRKKREKVVGDKLRG